MMTLYFRSLALRPQARISSWRWALVCVSLWDWQPAPLSAVYQRTQRCLVPGPWLIGFLALVVTHHLAVTPVVAVTPAWALTPAWVIQSQEVSPAVDNAGAQPSDSQGSFFTTRENPKVLPLPKAEDVFQFAIYGDRTGGVPEGLKVLEQAVVDTNLVAPDLVMTVGDLVQGYNRTEEWLQEKDEFKAIMNRLTMDWFPVAGNHDVYWQRRDLDKPAGQHEANYEEHFGPLWYSFKHKNAGFLVLFSDEGDPKTNEKGFNNPRLQMMSDRQIEFVRQALEQLKDQKHVFVFLHHPRWIGGNYEGCNWDRVHEILVGAGNVSAVFAGHIHRMRFDGNRDGIEYYALATTGGNLSQDFPAGGFLHHFNLVTVREEHIQVATIPIGTVVDPKTFTQEYLSQIETLRNVVPRVVKSLELSPNGQVTGSFEVEIENPASDPIDVSLTANIQRAWQVLPDHQHQVIPAGQSGTMTFKFMYQAPDAAGLPMDFSIPSLDLELDLLGGGSRLRVPGRTVPVAMKLSSVPEDFFSGKTNKAFKFLPNENAPDVAGIQIDHAAFSLPQGAFTLEAWVNSSSNLGSQAIVAKTQSSEYALFSHQGRPSFDVHLNGDYVAARASEDLPLNQWVHVAGVYDGKEVALYIDGKKVASNPGGGERTENDLPLMIAADPNGQGLATRPFAGMIDEVRLSQGARYQQAFQPSLRYTPDAQTLLLFHLDQNIGPFWVDHGPNSILGKSISNLGELVERN